MILMVEKPSYQELQKRVRKLEKADAERKRTEEALEKRILALTLPLDDAEGLRLEDLFNLDDLQLLQDEFASATGVASLITYPDGTPVLRPSNFCSLCMDIIQKTEKGLANCRRSDARIGLLSKEGLVIHPCYGVGLWDACAMIAVRGQHIANWGIGQVRDEALSEEDVRQYAREIGADEEEAAKAFYDVPSMSQEQFARIARMLQALANRLSTTAYQTVQQARFITELNRAKEALQESETHLRTLIRTIPDLVWLKDKKGRYLFCNSRFENFFNVTEKDIIGKTDYDFLDKDLADFFSMHDQLAMAKGRPSMNEEEVTFKSDGHRETLETIKTPMYGPDGRLNGVLGIGRDITERKRAEKEKARIEEQYRQAQKVEAIGRLAGGVAHDLNNLLTPILGYSEMLLNDLDEKDSRLKNLENIFQAAQSARDLVQQLLAFSRKQTLEYKPVDMNKAVAGFEKLLRRTIREDVEIRINLSPHIPIVMADIGQIEQVIMNMSVNAADAMSGGGLLTIETSPVTLDEQDAAIHQAIRPGPYVLLTIMDTGCGMDKETMKHIFEPFFSTKGEQGTGLGLSTVYGIIKQHHWNIWATSEPGKGTTFKVYLPAASEHPVEEKKGAGLPTDLEGTETILLVEDNELVRDISYSILSHHGYKVLVAAGGPEALTLMESHDGPVHLLLTDVIMPGMNGKELFTRAEERQPGLKVLYMSGYSDNVIVHQGILDKGVQMIQKPFTIHGLATRVREILEQE